MQDRQWPKGTVFTLGHSTLPIEQFIGLLKTYSADCLLEQGREQASPTGMPPPGGALHICPKAIRDLIFFVF